MPLNAKNSKLTPAIIFVLIIILLAVGVFISNNKRQNNSNINQNSALNTNTAVTTATTTATLAEPITGALLRVTKKPFGLWVAPGNSPVSPERFTGYHTGVDFETTPEEQNIDVPVYAICAGPLILKKSATGYGGVAVQSCTINQESVTVIYGHLRLASITASVNTVLKPGQQIGILGKGYSAETNGERKHLHLGIHQGTAVNLLGYVPQQNELNQWLDYLSLVK